MSHWIRRGLLLLVAGCALCGCATSALWENHAFSGFNEPARPPHLQVFKTQDDWLVQYDEVNEDSGRIRQRAYYLKANIDQVADHKTPRFVSRAVPLQSTAAGAVLSANGQEFALYDGPTYLGTYELPVYPAPSGRLKQVLLTPWTLVADATVVGGFIAVYYWLPAGAPGVADTH